MNAPFYFYAKSNIHMKLKMHIHAAIAALLVPALFSCRKDIPNYVNETGNQATYSIDKTTKTTGAFTTYIIPKGDHYCTNNSYPRFAAPALYFTVLFDSSAVYQSKYAHNQDDENKLYGFSDNNDLHHDFSARFGWRWYRNELELSAYTYNNGVRSDKSLGAVTIGIENKCAIIVAGDHYNFVLNGVTTAVPRASKTAQAIGYKLLPYFGGDEVAPHTIAIKIRDDKGL